MHTFIAVVVSLLVGAFATSSAEYFFKYNLVDLLKDKILGLFGKAEAKASAVKKVL